ncbi:hypothetical protein QJS10_CPB20g01280 [Acorus calamus]|uniref:protein-tyrosine-phosphatase n=1 Tax=Acorus calamus TaxID=4465 RepID=A0AAV9CBJ4_ACOCL|nr:hypothetical protein QJS10_CPB20g01280 [Acorus calamus]
MDQSSTSNNATKDPVNVYIWDLDETLILLKSLLTGAYAEALNGLKDSQTGVKIGKCWEKLILQVCDEHYFYEQIENYNEPFIDSLLEYDDGRDLSGYDFSNDGLSPPFDDSIKRKLAYRHRVIAQKYEQGLHNILDEKTIKFWSDHYDLTDNFTDGWLSSARAFLEQASGKSGVPTPCLLSSGMTTDSTDAKTQNIHFLVTSGSLIPSLVKLQLFHLDDFFSYKQVYSSWEVGKLQCFTWIKARFGGPSVRFCVIGDGFEECEAAERMRWPFIQIDLQPNGPHRFPGLTMDLMGHYINVVYDTSDAKKDDE